MIEKIQIRNFGANEELNIDFSPQVTTIAGRSYIGKSWLLRALRWVVLNKPSGDSFINWDSDKSKVKLVVDDKRIVRTRSKSLNTYKLSGKEESYVAFGNDVPKDIMEILNFSEINFQKQHTAPFWFCETAGEVSRQLNSIVNLDLIDSTLANIASEMRKSKAVIEITEEALDKAVQQKKELIFIEDLNEDLIDVEGMQKRYGEIARERATIDERLELGAKYGSIRENAAQQASDGLIVLSMGDRYRETADSVEKLHKLVESGIELQNILKAKPPDFSPLERLERKTKEATAQYQELDALIILIENRSDIKCQVEQDLTSYKKELQEIAGGRCPLCGAKMKT